MVLQINNTAAYGLNESSIGGVTPTDYSACTSYMEAAFQCMEECEANWNTFNNRLAMNELAFLAENGREIVYEEEAKQNILQKGISMIKSWLGKILGVLKKFAAEVSAKVANMSKWVGISKKNLKGEMNWPADKKINDFDYNAAAAKVKSMSFIDDKVDFGSGVDGTGEGLLSSAMYNTIEGWGGKDGNCTLKDIKDACLGEKKDLNASDYSSESVIAIITNFKAGIDLVNKRAKDAKDTANGMIASLKTIKPSRKDAKNDESQNNEAKAIHRALATITKINSLNSVLTTATLSILVGQLNLNKKFASVYLRTAGAEAKDAKKAEKKAVGEGSLVDILGFDLV